MNLICGKTARYCGIILRCRSILSIAHLLLLYSTYIKPIIHYGILVYGCANRTTLRKLQILQNRIIKTIFRRKKADHVSDIYNAYIILTVEQLHIYELLKYLVREHQLPNYQQTVAIRPRRAKMQRVDVPKTLTKMGEKCISVRSKNLQNGLSRIGINLDIFVGLTRSKTSIALHELRDNMICGNEAVCDLVYGT